MPPTEFITPVLSVARPLAFTFVVMRCFPRTARAVVVMLAVIVAIVTTNAERRAAYHKIVDALMRRDSKPRPDTPSGWVVLGADNEAHPRRSEPSFESPRRVRRLSFLTRLPR